MKKFLNQTFLLSATAISLSCSNNQDSGLMAYYDGDEWGYVDSKGDIIINPQFRRAYNFSEGLALMMNDDGLYGFIDDEGVLQGGEPSFKAATHFSEGRAWTVKPLGSPTCIDKSGDPLFSCETCDYVGNYSEGLAWFGKQNDDGELEFGYLNKKGEIEINAQFSRALDFKDGLAVVQNKKGKFGYINSKGDLEINYQFEDAFPFNDNGLAVVYDGKKYGWINTDGKYVCNPQFKSQPSNIDDDLWIVGDGDKFGLTTNDGKYIVNPQFDWIYAAEPNQDHDLLAFRDGTEWGYIDQEGKIVINAQFDGALPFVNGLAIVKSSNGYGIIDKEGKYTVNPQFDNLRMNNYSSKGEAYVESEYVDLSSLSKDLSAIHGILDGSLSIGEILMTLGSVSEESFVSSYYPQYQYASYGKQISEAGMYLDDVAIYNGDLRTTVQEKVSSGWYTYTTEKKVLLKDKIPSLWRFSLSGTGKLYGNMREAFDAALLPELKSLLSGYDFNESETDDEDGITYTFTNSTDIIYIEVGENRANFAKVARDTSEESADAEEAAE